MTCPYPDLNDSPCDAPLFVFCFVDGGGSLAQPPLPADVDQSRDHEKKISAKTKTALNAGEAVAGLSLAAF